jgi:hypothetical protein
VGGGADGAWAMLALWPFLAYLLLTGVTTFSINPAMWPLTWLGVFASHVTYGVRFLQGLFAAKAPCEFIGRDHAQGKKR